METRLDGKIALVTGAAGSGIGQATSLRLARDGASVVVTDIHQERISRTVERIREETRKPVIGFHLDAGSLEDVERVVTAVETSLGPIDIVVNNAAINELCEVAEMSLASWDSILGTDLTGPFALIRRTLPSMKRRGWGSIVNVTSVASFTSPPREAPYAAAKAALQSLTRTVAIEAGPYGVRCNAVAPGLVWTRFLEKNAALFQAEVDRTPLRRFGQPDEVASVITFLISDEAKFITGETLVVSGGWYMSA